MSRYEIDYDPHNEDQYIIIDTLEDTIVEDGIIDIRDAVTGLDYWNYQD